MFDKIPEDKLHHNYRTIVVSWNTDVTTLHDTTIFLATEHIKKYYDYKQTPWWAFWEPHRGLTFTCFPHDKSKDSEFYGT